MPQLDGLRTLAVAGVVLQHGHILRQGATHGVHLFFVLSGFLITGILLASRQNLAATGGSRAHAFRQFYIRRALRIFPLYFAVVSLGLIFNADYAREFAPWLLTYTINIKMAAQGWFIGNFAHFWSLAIEEQYYLVWPWLILLLPRRWLLPAGIVMTAIGPLFRLFLVIGWNYLDSDASGLQSYIATPAALDSLGIGSLIAIMMTGERTRRAMEVWMRWAVPVTGLGLAAVLSVLGGEAYTVLWNTAIALFFAWLIYRASLGFSGIAGKLLSATPMVYLGRISYGIYVYHALVPNAVTHIATRLGLQVPETRWPSFLLFTTLTLIIAALSWHFFERPINELKRHFPYLGQKKPALPESPITLETSDAHR